MPKDTYETHEGEMKNEAELAEELEEKGEDIEKVKAKHFDEKEEEDQDTVQCEEGADVCPA